jgi:(+)-neomenthol dehydrogenase
VLGDAENLTEERVDEVLGKFLKDFKDGPLETKGWSCLMAAYRVSNAECYVLT